MSSQEQGNPGLAYMQSLQNILQVVHQMREIPVLPSEAPKDTEGLVKVEFPEEGGVFTTLTNMDYPYPGFPFGELVEKTDMLKKIARSSLVS